MRTKRVSEDAIFQSLRDAILSRTSACGTPLREMPVRNTPCASRRTVDKARDRSRYEGLVSRKPHCGAPVAQPTPPEAKDHDLMARRTGHHIAGIAAANDLKPRACVVRALEDVLKIRGA